MSRKATSILVGSALVALLSGAAYSQERIGKDALLGEPIPADGPVDKVVKIDANTRWVNVVQNESVKFIVGGATFAWHFPVDRNSINLKEIAPSGTVNRDLYVYVTPDPFYLHGE